MIKEKSADKPAAAKPVYILFAQKSVTLNGKQILRGESIDADTWKKLCHRVQPYFRKISN